ncbi:hypothetical protein RIR_jg40939.t1 [Rhizophagus irregularis DAOM 181602=DAOM 197198]|nr:hypothetical protein RIR_jg40939.t1 [Rhizophagus irregularis DAOM 181602=DAOM 197198]
MTYSYKLLTIFFIELCAFDEASLDLWLSLIYPGMIDGKTSIICCSKSDKGNTSLVESTEYIQTAFSIEQSYQTSRLYVEYAVTIINTRVK